MKPTPAIWGIFTVLFCCFSAFHFIQMASSFPKFKLQAPNPNRSEFYSEGATMIEHNVKNFVDTWNAYIEKQNRLNFWRSFISALTYLASAFMAFRSIPSDATDNAMRHARNCCSNAKAYIKGMGDKIKQRSHK